MPPWNPHFLLDEQSRLSSKVQQNRYPLGMPGRGMDLPLNITTTAVSGVKFPFMTANGTALPENTE